MIRIRVGPRSAALYRIAAIASAIAFVLGCWRVFVHHGWRPGLFWQLVFPLLVLRLSLTLYRRSRAA